MNRSCAADIVERLRIHVNGRDRSSIALDSQAPLPDGAKCGPGPHARLIRRRPAKGKPLSRCSRRDECPTHVASSRRLYLIRATFAARRTIIRTATAASKPLRTLKPMQIEARQLADGNSPKSQPPASLSPPRSPPDPAHSGSIRSLGGSLAEPRVPETKASGTVMGASQRIIDRRDDILRVAALHGAGNVMLFGSVARGENTSESDVDLLVDVTGDTTP